MRSDISNRIISWHMLTCHRHATCRSADIESLNFVRSCRWRWEKQSKHGRYHVERFQFHSRYRSAKRNGTRHSRTSRGIKSLSPVFGIRNNSRHARSYNSVYKVNQRNIMQQVSYLLNNLESVIFFLMENVRIYELSIYFIRIEKSFNDKKRDKKGFCDS